VRLLQRAADEDELAARRAAAEVAIREMGISFTVYSEAGNIDRAWPFDLIPRVITAREWAKVRRGLEQRSRALNLFINDVYNKQKIFADGVFRRRPSSSQATSRNSAWARRRVSASGRTSAAQTSSAIATASSTCSRTTCACPPACLLHGGESRDHQARAAGAVRELQHSARRRLPDAAVPHAGGAVATGPQAPDDRGADAGHLQLRVLRARLPRPGHGRGAGRGRRPVCRR
jgi:hypothetical protein